MLLHHFPVRAGYQPATEDGSDLERNYNLYDCLLLVSYILLCWLYRFNGKASIMAILRAEPKSKDFFTVPQSLFEHTQTFRQLGTLSISEKWQTVVSLPLDQNVHQAMCPSFPID